jgi:caa(3)-type oxidase subunit IV
MSVPQHDHHQKTEAKAHKQPNYLGVFFALAVLTATITAIELMAQNGAINWPRPVLNSVYLTMSIIKALLVAMYYMHLKVDSLLYTVLFGMPVLFAIVFFTLLLI